MGRSGGAEALGWSKACSQNSKDGTRPPVFLFLIFIGSPGSGESCCNREDALVAWPRAAEQEWNPDLLLGNQVGVLCMGPVSRLLSLLGRFSSLMSIDFKNVVKPNIQEGSQGPEHAQPGWDLQSTGSGSPLVYTAHSGEALSQGVCWQDVGDR